MANMVSSTQGYQFRSQSNRPVSEMDLLEASLLFAELAKVSYFERGDVECMVQDIGITQVEFYDRDGAQAYCLENESDLIVVCRGTEPDEVNDVKADVNVLTVAAETVGRVHRGFKSEADDIWPQIEQAIAGKQKPLWFAGHSLGGAMATICAGRCFLSDVSSMPRGLYTFGSPRVGDRRYINYCDIKHYRWVNNNDIVPRLPPAWFGYRHAAEELYINTAGKLANLKGIRRTFDRLRGLAHSSLRFRVDYLSDHPIDRYIEQIAGM
ncbi:MAG: lipase family protein [Pirellulaceae bacterium]|nr:lipase family protein [Pirellulaceae bacterium]